MNLANFGPGVVLIAAALPRLPRLARLDIKWIRISDGIAEALAPHLGQLTALTLLDMSHMYMRDGHITSRAPALARLSRLAALDLSYNEIKGACVPHLAPALACLPSLRSVDLARTDFSSEGRAGKPPRATGQRLPSLRSVDLRRWKPACPPASARPLCGRMRGIVRSGPVCDGEMPRGGAPLRRERECRRQGRSSRVQPEKQPCAPSDQGKKERKKFRGTSQAGRGALGVQHRDAVSGELCLFVDLSFLFTLSGKALLTGGRGLCRRGLGLICF